MSRRARSLHRLGLALLVIAVATAPFGLIAQHAELPTATPASVGFSSERLKAVDTALQKLVDEGALSGIVTLIARKGKVVHQALIDR
jgi:hypothetical protein